MSERLWIVLGILAGIAFGIQVALPVDLSERPETSFETAPRGHAALFELLQRFDANSGRWLSGVTMPPVDDTLWWIAPNGVCDASRRVESASEAEAEVGAVGGLDVPFRYIASPWIEAGGTAVVWLSHPPLLAREETFEPEAPEFLEIGFQRSAAYDERGEHVRERPHETQASAGDGEATDAEDADSVRDGWKESIEAVRQDVREGEPERCLSIAGFALPNRRLAGLEGGELPIDVESAATVFSVGRWVESRERFDYESARPLPGPTLAFFENDPERLDGWQPLWVEADDFTPFALERRLGAGRLIVVADARVLTNGRLGKLDAAPFVFDWVEDLGVPWIDEHHHGVVPESGTFRYLASSPAWAAGLGLMGLGLLVLWRGQAWPRRRVDEVDPAAPTLVAFVDSVARLYSDAKDHQQVFERYRALSLERIRRALGLAPGTPAELLLERLRTRVSKGSTMHEQGLRDLLTREVRVDDAASLRRATDRLDSFVHGLREETGNRDVAEWHRNEGVV
jgi:hypothetical protein